MISLRALAGTALAVYLGLAPVYWLPGVSLRVLFAVKAGLLGFAAVAAWLQAFGARRARIPRGLAGWIGFVLLALAALPGVWQSEPQTGVARLADIGLGYGMLWTVYLLAREAEDSVRLLWPAAALVAAWACIALAGSLHPSANWVSPESLGGRSVADAGFGGGRTGWSNGVALYVPLLVGGIALRMRSRIRRAVTGIAAAMLLLVSQAVTGGRAGLLASLAGFVCVAVRVSGVRGILALLGAAGAAGIANWEFLYDRLRLYRLAGGLTLQNLNRFSAGRIDIYMQAVDLFTQRPLLGHGFGGYSLVGFHGTEIHNVWLRLAVEGGLLLPVVFGAVVTYILVRALAPRGAANLPRTGEEPVRWAALQGVLLSGLVVSMFEPNVLLGTFQPSALWWAAAGAVMAESSRARVARRSSLAQGTRGAGAPVADVPVAAPSILMDGRFKPVEDG